MVGDLVVEAGGFDGVDGVDSDRVLDAGHMRLAQWPVITTLLEMPLTLTTLCVAGDRPSLFDSGDVDIGTRRWKGRGSGPTLMRWRQGFESRCGGAGYWRGIWSVLGVGEESGQAAVRKLACGVEGDEVPRDGDGE